MTHEGRPPVAFSPSGVQKYSSKLFDKSYVHTVDISISDGDWSDLKANPTDKTKYKVDVTIDGEKIEQASFATKGNTSLSSVASNADSDRYSFKVNFGKYVDGQTYYGLDKLNLNNLYADATYMKDYLSYTGSMLHNYYLYENDGKLSMLPWDYNLAFGGFGGGGDFGGGGFDFSGGFPGFGGQGGSGQSAPSGEVSQSAQSAQSSAASQSAQAPEAGASFNDATSLVNKGIDSPLSGADESSRPMWPWIVGSDQYKSQYHAALDSLVKNYFESGDLEKEIDALYEMLLPYVQKGPSAFYTADEFTEGYKNLKQFCLLRAQSIRAQLDGSLASTTSEQTDAAKVDASAVNVDAMGSQGGGKDGPDAGGRREGGR